ncbi:MAG TPA: tetratricopeptide repeat protein [Gammaproteobacteria bacterium]|nr:tetratricopeptide repeat protein [Gammaproteobacteria bacterium]
MKLLISVLVVLIAAVLVALYTQDDVGYVLISYRDWTVETSFVFLVGALIIGFGVTHYAIRLLDGTWHLPRYLGGWRRKRRIRKAEASLSQGLTALAAGRWAEAENALIKHVKFAENPQVNYLAAARAAQGMGDLSKRDYYLRMAYKANPGNELAVRMTQAELQRDQGQLQQAMTTLSNLRIANPKHVAVLKMMMELALEMKDWERLLDISTDLEQLRVTTVERANELRRDAYQALFSRYAERDDVEAMRRLWQKMPKAQRRRDDVVFEYARFMIALGADGDFELEGILADAIRRSWNDSLVYLYGLLDCGDVTLQIGRAQGWLRHQPNNAVLLLTLGRLCIRDKRWQDARRYLEESLRVRPLPEAYRELGTLLEHLNEQGAAIEYYRQALTLLPGGGQGSLPPPSKSSTPAKEGSSALPAAPGMVMLPAESV